MVGKDVTQVKKKKQEQKRGYEIRCHGGETKVVGEAHGRKKVQ